jgi:hypothetical protein
MLDIFNLDAEHLITKTKKEDSKESDFYKPYPDNGKDGVYKSLIRFLPNIVDPGKSKIHKYYVYLTDPSSGEGFSADCPSTVGKKSILKDIFWKLKNSHSAADQDLSKSFSRKEDYYSLVQIVQDKNNPELEGKIMIFKFGKKLNDLLEAQLKPEYGDSCNPFDLFTGKLFSIQTRKVGEWNNYDLCQFVGDKCSIEINGRKMQKTPEDMKVITEYLEQGPKNLTNFEYKDWDDQLTERVMRVIRQTVPDGRLVNEILSGVNVTTTNSLGSNSAQASSPQAASRQQEQFATSYSSNSLYEEASSTSVGKQPEPQSNTGLSRPSAPTTASSLDDLYADL